MNGRVFSTWYTEPLHCSNTSVLLNSCVQTNEIGYSSKIGKTKFYSITNICGHHINSRSSLVFVRSTGCMISRAIPRIFDVFTFF